MFALRARGYGIFTAAASDNIAFAHEVSDYAEEADRRFH